MPEQSLNIYLINEGLTRSDIIKKIATKKNYRFRVNNQVFDVYAKPLKDESPDWFKFFENNVPIEIIGESDSPSAAVLLTIGGRTYALTFGGGRHLLFPDCYEDQFGLRVVLNSVDKVRSLDTRTFDKLSRQTRTQAAADANISEFEFDREQDLLRGVTGRPQDESLGIRMSGVDALSAHVDVSLQSLPDLLQRYLHQSRQTSYRDKGFAFVDQMKAVTSTTIKEDLNNVLIHMLENRIEELFSRNYGTFEIEMIIPEIVDFARISGFRYTPTPSSQSLLRDINIDTFLRFKSSKGWTPALDSLKRSGIFVFQGERDLKETWSAYKCLSGEIEHNNKRFVISDGHWYEIDPDFIGRLDKYLEEIGTFEIALPLYRGEVEKVYNERVPREIPGIYNFDRQLIHPETADPFEFCDLYTETADFREIIHVKRGTSSAALSHLFSQGTVSVELCTDFEQCKTASIEMVREVMDPVQFAAPDRAKNFRVVYAIIRKGSRPLPFFSRVNLKRSFQHLKRTGHACALALIGYDPMVMDVQIVPSAES